MRRITEVEQLEGEACKGTDCPCESVTAIGLSVVSRVHDRDEGYKMQDPSLPSQKISDAGGHQYFGQAAPWRRDEEAEHGQVSEHHAEMLINLAKNTIGIREGVSGLSLDIRHILVQLEMLRTLIAEIEGEMEIGLGKIPYSSKLLSIKGLGVVSVAGIIGEIGDF